MSIYCNSDYVQHFTLTGRLKVPVVLSVGADIEVVFIKSSTAERYVCNVGNGRVVINNGALGKFSVEMPAAFTATMIPGDYTVEAHRVDNQRTRLFTGFIAVKAAA